MQERPVERLPGATAQRSPFGRPRARVEQVEVDVKALEVPDVTRSGDLSRLDHACACPARRLGAERGALIAVKLEHAQTKRLARGGDLIEWSVHEHATQLCVAAQRARDPLRLRQRAGARAVLEEDHPQRPRSELDRQFGVAQACEPAHLHAGWRRGHTPTVAGSYPSGVFPFGTELGRLASVTLKVFFS